MILIARTHLRPCATAVARKIPFDDPQTLFYVRVAYIATQAITLLVYYYTASKIRAKKDMTTLKYGPHPQFSPSFSLF